MTQPEYLPYQTFDLNAADRSYLNVLSILHYVWGGLEILFACFGLIYVAIGVMMLSGTIPQPTGPGMTPAQIQQAQQSVAIGGSFMLGCGSIGTLGGWTLGILTIIGGRRIAQRRSRVFSIVMASINCISFPFGTALGVFTIILLSKDSVKAMYEPHGIN